MRCLLLLAHAARAELYVNCMAAEDSNPLGMGCHSVNQDVLHMLDYCSAPSDDNIQGWKIKYVGRLVDYTKPTSTRLLRSREEHQLQNHRREQSEERDLKSSCGYCCHTGLSAGGRMACCLYGGNQYSYCGSPTGDRRLASTKNIIAEEIDTSETPLDATIMLEADMAAITKQCTKDFKNLAKEYAHNSFPHCIGSFQNVFCQTVQVFAA